MHVELALLDVRPAPVAVGSVGAFMLPLRVVRKRGVGQAARGVTGGLMLKEPAGKTSAGRALVKHVCRRSGRVGLRAVDVERPSEGPAGPVDGDRPDPCVGAS